MEVMKQEPKLVQWTCRKGPAEWIDTEITFDLKQENDFHDRVVRPLQMERAVEFMAHCSMKWAVFLMSLKEFAETGKGKAAPRDIKINNWN